MRSRSKNKPERDVRSLSPASKSILKKTKAEQEDQRKLDNQGPKFNQILPGGVYPAEASSRPPIKLNPDSGNAAEKLDQIGTGQHAQIIDDRFEQYLLGQKKLAYELGDQKKAIHNLQFSLQERVAQYETHDIKIWRITETLSDIAIHFAIQMSRIEKNQEASDYLNLARRALEPLPGSEWAQRHEWQVLRRDLFKNLALFNQNQDEWQKAFDNLRFAISHERTLGESTANTSLTCAVLLSKMARFAESIEYAQQCCNEIEKEININHLKPLAEYKYQGKSKETMLQRDKQFTTYGIANHLMAKALLNLQYYKEARYFMNKASTAINKCLNQPKRELSVAIGNDMARLSQIQRGSQQKILTAEQVQGSLVTIKADLATRAMSGIGGDRIEQRLIMKLTATENPDDGDKGSENQAKELLGLDVQNELKASHSKKRSDEKPVLQHAEQEEKLGKNEDRKSVNAIKKTGKDAENLTGNKKSKSEDALDKIGPQQVRDLKERIKNKTEKEVQEKIKQPKRKKSENVKIQEMNPAKLGAKEDLQGIKYSEDRSVKSYLRARKQQIREVNKDLGYSESDQSIPEIRPEQDKNASLPPLARSFQKAAKSPGTEMKQDQVYQKREFLYKKQDFIDIRPDQPNSNTIKLISQIQDSIDKSTHKQKSPSPTKTDQTQSDDQYSDEAINEINEKLQQQLKNKKKDRIEDFLSDLKEGESPKRPNSGLIRTDDQYLSQDQSSAQGTTIMQKPADSQKNQLPKIPTGEKDKGAQNRPQTKSASNKTQKTGQIDSQTTTLPKIQSQQELSIKSKLETGLKSLFRQKQFKEAPEDKPLSTLQRQGTPPLEKQIKAEKAKLKLQKASARKNSARQPSQDKSQAPETAQIKNPFAPKGTTANKRSSLIYALKMEKGINTFADIKSDHKPSSSQIQPTPNRSKKRPSSSESQSQNPLHGDDRRVFDEGRMLALSKPKQRVTKELTEEEIERQNEKQREYNERKLKYKKFDFSEFVSKDEYIDPNSYQVISSKQQAKVSAYRGTDEIEQRRKELKKRERDEARKNIMRVKKLIKPIVEPSDSQPESKVSAQDKALRNAAQRDKFQDLLQSPDSSKPTSPFASRYQDKSPARSKNMMSAIESAVSKRIGTVSPNRKGGLSGGDPDDRGTLMVNNVRNNPKRAGYNPKSPDRQEASVQLSKGSAASKFQIAANKVISIKRGGKAPTQNQMRTRVSNNRLDPYQQNDVLNDSDVVADRQGREQSNILSRLRNLEKASAIKIQTLVRRFFTRKWYVNLLVRKRLSVPFSGLEFSNCPFLRQFNRVNQKLQATNQHIVEVVNRQESELKRNMVQTKTPLSRRKDWQKPKKENNKVDNQEPKLEETPVVTTIKVSQNTPKRRIVKGATPDELLAELKNDFIDKGLDAYTQFKKLGVGVDFDEQGNAFAEGGIQKVRQIIHEQRQAKLAFIGNEQERNRDERAYVDPQKLETAETKEYLDIAEKRRNPQKDKSGAKDNVSSLVRAHQMNQFGLPQQPTNLKTEEYQSYSREPIVFFKRLGFSQNNNLKWTIYAGSVFINKDDKMYLPVKIIGKPLKSRSTIVMYTMNLELMEIRKSQLQDYEFETIWPIILYLFNNWVKHQVTLMGIKRILPGMQDRLPDSNYTIFECHNDLKQDFEALEDEAYKDMLNFSSELEIDDRFELDDPKVLEEQKIDKSRPEGIRKTVRETAQDKRRRLFNEYRNSVARAIDQQEKQMQMQAGRRFVHFSNDINKNLSLEEQLNMLGDNKDQEKKFYLNQTDVDQFKTFLNDNYIRLPKPQSNQLKLMRAMAQSIYLLIQKKGGLSSMHIALLNEERRKIKSLPPLTQIDYNCIDRAALKLRLILDCLQLERRISGVTLVPRDLKYQQRVKEYSEVVQKNYEFVLKRPNLSVNLLKLIGVHIQFGPTFDQKTQALKMQGPYPPDGLLHSQEETLPSQINQQDFQIGDHAKQEQRNQKQGVVYEDELDQQLLGDQDSFKSSQIGIFRNMSNKQMIPVVNVSDSHIKSEIFAVPNKNIVPITQDYSDVQISGRKDLRQDMQQQEFEYESKSQSEQAFLEKYYIETILQEESVLDQGCIRFNSQVYICTIAFKRIHCNYDNVRILTQIREKKYQKEPSKLKVGQQKKKFDISDKTQRDERVRAKPCSLISTHPTVRINDSNYIVVHDLKGNMLVDLQVEMNNLVWTRFQTYLEVKLQTRLSSTMWADSVLISWETIQKFFRYFGLKNWDQTGFLKRQQFDQAEAFLFYNFFSECLAVDQDDRVTLTFSLDRLDDSKHKYEAVYLHLKRFEWTQRVMSLNFFYPDILINTNFDHCTHDELVYPFMQDPNQVNERIMKIDEKTLKKIEIGKLTNQITSNKLEINKDFSEGSKPELLLDEETVAYLQDPTSLFNLTLSKFPKSQTIFLGGLSLQPAKSSDFVQGLTITNATKLNKALQLTNTNTKYNVRIDYYVRGVTPCLQIRAFSQLVGIGGSTSQVLNITLNQPKLIKDFIRICGQNNQQMVINQLQSILAVGQEMNGKRIVINHSYTRQRKVNSQIQDIYTMLILNEQVFSGNVGPHNTQKYKGIINLKNLSKGMSSVLAHISQYDLQSEILLQHGDIMIQLMHGNKHITQQMINKTRDLIIQKTLETNPETQLKEYTSLTIWKVTINDMRKSIRSDAILTQEDLNYYYETEIFQFYRDNPQIQMPNILVLLKEYLTNLYKIRTPVGSTLVWNLPQYKPLIDKNGLVLEIEPDQLHKLQVLRVYQEFVRLREQQNAFSDQEKLPMSLDIGRKQRMNGQIPKLCLKTRSCIERVLPIYEAHDVKALKYSSTQFRVLANVSRVFTNISQFHFCVVTVTHHETMECWIVNFYFPINQRTFTCTFFASDLFALDQKIFDGVQDDESALWSRIVNQMELQVNQIGDIIIKIDSYCEAIKELLYQTYAYNDGSKDIYFVEVTLKSFGNYVTDMKKAFLAIDLKDQSSSKDFTVSLRAYSLAREQWIKDYQPLIEVISMLQQDGVLRDTEIVKEGGQVQTKSDGADRDQILEVSNKTTTFYYSMIRNAAVLMANKITFAERPQQSYEVKKRKLTYDLQQILKAKRQPGQPGIRGDFQNLIQLNRTIFQSTVALNPVQICSVTYNESKDRFVYRLYRPFDSMSIERRFEGTEIQRTCCPHYIQMLGNSMEKELGQRIAKFYHANILIASVLQMHNMQGLVDAYPKFNPNESASKAY